MGMENEMITFKLWNYDLDDYQYYYGGYEIVELSTRSAVKKYVEEFDGDYRIDRFDHSDGTVKKDILID